MSLPQQFQRNQAGAKPASPGCAGTAILLLFGIAFSFAGLFVLRMDLTSLREYLAMKSWKEVPARILDAQVTSHRGSKGGTTYGIGVKYEYTFEGQTRQGTRADLFQKLHDGSGTYQRGVVAQLQAAQSGGRTIPCYVNPANPAESILNREMRWGAFAAMTLFSLPFCAVGFGALGGLVYSWRRGRAARELQSLYPDAPWQWRGDWAEGRIRSSSKGGAIGITVFALFWNSIAFPLLILGGREIFAKGPSVQWVVLIFPLVGVFLIGAAVRAWRAWSILGDPVFSMTSVPGMIGGVLAGTIGARCLRQPSSPVELALACIERSSKSDEGNMRIIWQDRRTLRAESVQMGPEGLTFPVLFQIPWDYDQGGAGDEAGYIWRLSLKGKFEGVASRALFEVPVFKTAASEPNFKPDQQAEAAYFEAPAPADILQASAVSLEPLSGGGRRYVFHANRLYKLVLPLLLFIAIWTAFVAGLWFWRGPLMIRIIFSFFEFLILWIVTDVLFWAGQVDVAPQGVAFTGGVFSKAKTVYVAADDIQRFTLNNGMVYGGQVFYDLQVETRAGKKITLGKRLKERSHGEWLIAEMEKDLKRQEKVGAELNA